MSPVGLYLLIALVFGACAIPLMRRLPRTVPPPLTVAPDSARRHIALIYLIRSGEAMIVIPIVLGLAVLGVSVLLSPFHSGDLYVKNDGASFLMLPAALLICAIVVIRCILHFQKPGRALSVFKKLEDVNENNIGTFSFVFAAFAAHDYYRLMPPAPLHSTSLANRDCWVLVFWGFWIAMKFILKRILEVTPPSSRQSPPDDPDIPEFPHRSPLRPL